MKNILKLIALSTVIYLCLAVLGMLSWIAIMTFAYASNTSGNLIIPSVLFVSITSMTILLQWSPISLAVTNALGYAFALIPGAGDPNFRTDVANANKIANIIWQSILIAFSLPLLAMSLWWIPSVEADVLMILLVAIVALLIWSIATNTQKTKVWRAYFILGFFGLAKALVFMYPTQVYEITGMYPGVHVDNSVIVANTKEIAERDAKVLNKRGKDAITAFNALLKKKFDHLTSDELIQKSDTFLRDGSITPKEYKIIKKEETRRENTTTKKMLRKVSQKLESAKNIFADEPEPVWTDVGEMSYIPDEPKRKRVSTLLEDTRPGMCIIECRSGYNQYFDNRGGTLPIQCGGRSRVDAIPEDGRFPILSQLIRVQGVTYAVKTEPFPCSDRVTADFLPNASTQEKDYFINNTGKAVFVVKKLLKPQI